MARKDRTTFEVIEDTSVTGCGARHAQALGSHRSLIVSVAAVSCTEDVLVRSRRHARHWRRGLYVSHGKDLLFASMIKTLPELFANTMELNGLKDAGLLREYSCTGCQELGLTAQAVSFEDTVDGSGPEFRVGIA